jgi:predicted TIM-barrel fold metal-dependent hydrolase
VICDAHVHFFSPTFFATLAAQRKVATADAIRHLGWDDPSSPEALADRWAAELDAQGVSRAAIIASVPGDEGSVVAAVERHPSRFTGYFMLDPTPADAETRVMAALERGLRGVCLFPAMQGYSLHDPRVARVAEVVAAFGRAVMAMRHPAMPIVIPHFGAGLFREALMVADQCLNVHFDTSSSNGWVKYQPGLTLAQVFESALAVTGSSRLLFGSDSSFFPRGWHRAIYNVQRMALAEVGVSEAQQGQIFGGNFDRLFPPTRQ